jgi:cysteine desulfurase/selenocysteine lyase
MLRIPGPCVIGMAAEKASVLSFVLAGYRTEEVGAALDREGTVVRVGHHYIDALLSALRSLSERRGVRSRA